MPFSPEQVQALREPFPADIVKWKVQANPTNDRNMALVVAFIDARDVAERLDAVTNGDWSDDYGLPVVNVQGVLSVECRLTMCGITRKDVGSVELEDGPHADNGEAVKSVYSDAFKRAALKFGVNAPMYRYPTVFAQVERRGRSFVITRAAEHELDILTRCISDCAVLPRLNTLWVFGYRQGEAAGNLNGDEASSFVAPVHHLTEHHHESRPLRSAPEVAETLKTRLASDAQLGRMLREVGQSQHRATAAHVDALGEEFGIPDMTGKHSVKELRASCPGLTITQASNLINALQGLGNHRRKAS